MGLIEKRTEFKTMVQVGKISCGLLHDLISPITSLSLYAETISDKRLRQIVDPIAESTNNIREFISLIQDAIEKPNQLFRVNLYDTIVHAIRLGRHKAISNNIDVEIKFCASKKIELYCKKLEIYQIIMNLVGNAVDALIQSKKKTRLVVVKVSCYRKVINLTVSDNGCGIPDKIKKKIFNKSFTTKQNGMGIGLYTVKNNVEKSFCGKIELRSRLNYGSEFKVSLPLK